MLFFFYLFEQLSVLLFELLILLESFGNLGACQSDQTLLLLPDSLFEAFYFCQIGFSLLLHFCNLITEIVAFFLIVEEFFFLQQCDFPAVNIALLVGILELHILYFLLADFCLLFTFCSFPQSFVQLSLE